MAEQYQPLPTSSVQSVATSIEESIHTRSNTEILSDDDLDIEFASFKGYSDNSIEKMLVQFKPDKLSFTQNSTIEVVFFTYLSTYEMKPDDIVGICPLRKTQPFIWKKVGECADYNGGDLDIINPENKIVSKKAILHLGDLSAELASEIYFQFRYQTAQGETSGLSIPFRIEKSDSSKEQPIDTLNNQGTITLDSDKSYEDMVMEKRDEDDFIVVRSQESLFKEHIENLTKSNTLLDYMVRSLEKDLSNKSLELQQKSKMLEIEKEKVAKLKEEKFKLITDLECLNTKHVDMQSSMDDLKALIAKEKTSNETLQAQLELSKEKITNLETTFKNFQSDEDDLRNILADKEEEINELKSQMARIYTEFEQERIQASTMKKEFDSVAEYNLNLANRLVELEALNEKQKNEIKAFEVKSTEIKSLEDELRNAVANMKNISIKLQAEREANERKDRDFTKVKMELIEMHARFERSKVEYASLFQKYQALKSRFISSKPTNSNISTDNSIAPKVATSKTTSDSDAKLVDEIDLALSQLDNDEHIVHQAEITQEPLVKSVANISLFDSKPSETLLIDIDSSGNAASKQQQQQTTVKTIASTSRSSPIMEKTNVVRIPCIMCNQTIECRQREDGSGQMTEMVEHFEQTHKQKMCPVCSTLFDTSLPAFSSYFKSHIDNHFISNSYPYTSSLAK